MTLEDDNGNKVALAWVKMRRESYSKDCLSLYLPFYDKLNEILDSDPRGQFFAPYSMLRTLSEQQTLYSQGRTTKGNIVTNAQAGDSPHNWGCATDYAEFNPNYAGSEIWNLANWDFYAECVRKAGLFWGGDFERFEDRPHNQLYLTVPWKKVGDMYRAQGIEAAVAFIKSKIRGS